MSHGNDEEIKLSNACRDLRALRADHKILLSRVERLEHESDERRRKGWDDRIAALEAKAAPTTVEAGFARMQDAERNAGLWQTRYDSACDERDEAWAERDAARAELARVTAEREALRLRASDLEQDDACGVSMQALLAQRDAMTKVVEAARENLGNDGHCTSGHGGDMSVSCWKPRRLRAALAELDALTKEKP